MFTQFACAESSEAWVPGGIQAFSIMAHLNSAPSPENFFLEYCRALIWEQSPANRVRQPGYAAMLQAYIASVAELQRLGERHGDSTIVKLSLANEPGRRNAERVLPLLGWKLVRLNGSYSVEPGDRPADGLRQPIPSAFGIDEIGMQAALEAGREFQFAAPSENAPLAGAARWSGFLRISADGMAEAFAKNLHLAKVYAGLAAMSEEIADALIETVGLRTLVAVYPEVLSSYAEAFTVAQGRAATPGGAAAEAVWSKLAGASPRDPPAFFRALLQKDHGILAAFYHALSRADGAHQRFFTQSLARAESFYLWYRDSGEVFLGVNRKGGSWRPAFLQNLSLDDAGHVRFPGGLRAWSASAEPGDDALLDIRDLEALARWRAWTPRARLRSIMLRSMSVPPNCWLSTTRSGAACSPISKSCPGWEARNFRPWRLFPARWPPGSRVKKLLVKSRRRKSRQPKRMP